MSYRIPVTIVNHIAVDIAVAPAIVWAAIIEEFVEAKGFRALGTVTPLDDPAAPLGGYRMQLDYGDGVPDERMVHFTERDDAARRLSIFANYLSVPGGMTVYATYHAQETPNGARFAVDCHTRVEVDLPVGASRTDVAASVAGQTASYDEVLTTSLKKMKERLERAE